VNETQELRTVEPEDLFKLKFLQDGQLSPDGKTVAYMVSRVETENEELEEHVAIWLLSLETGETRQLTAGLARDAAPRWSPDGRQIAFISTRNEKPQIYIIPVDGGEARALTAMKQGVGGGPEWSPDGKRIAFTAVPEEEPLDLKAPYRLTRHTFRFDEMGYLENVLQDIYVIPVEGGEPKRLTDDACQKDGLAWSPDGREILFSAVLFPDSHRLHPDVRVVNLEGEVRTLLKDWGKNVVSAAWTPDGTKVVLIASLVDEPIGTQNDLWIVASQGGEPECRTAGLDLQVGGGLQPDMPVMAVRAPRILIPKDGQTAYTQVQDGGTVQIYRIALSGPESCVSVLAGERACIPQDMKTDQLLFLVSTLDNPTDLYLTDLSGAGERRLTHLNADLLARWDLPAIKNLRFPGSDGVQVEGWIMLPPAGQPPYPTILYIHGGPHSAFGHMFSFDFQMLAGAGYAVLFINHRASTGYGNAFSTQIIGDWGNLDYKDLMAGIDVAIEKGIANPDRLGCCGISGGGNLSCWIVGQTDRFKAAVPENPVTNWQSFYGVSDIGPWFAVEEMGGLPHEIPEVYRRCSPITFAHRCTTPTLLVQGEHDWHCPAEQSEQFYTVLKANGCVVEMLRLPGSPHAGSITGPPVLRRAQNEALLEWMNRYVLGIEPEEKEEKEIEKEVE
jgi:dipeptidyl aminopeptidase/acylaminoacyl peptidase